MRAVVPSKPWSKNTALLIHCLWNPHMRMSFSTIADVLLQVRKRLASSDLATVASFVAAKQGGLTSMMTARNFLRRAAETAVDGSSVICSNPQCGAEQDRALFKSCGRCHLTKYCGAACQRAHWKQFGHKRECVPASSLVLAACLIWSLHSATALAPGAVAPPAASLRWLHVF